MTILHLVGNSVNTPTHEYISESMEELNRKAEKAPFGSTALLIGEDSAKIYILNSRKQWVEMK